MNTDEIAHRLMNLADTLPVKYEPLLRQASKLISDQSETIGVLHTELDPRKRSLVYLATPYNHADPAVRQWRFEQVNRAAARLMAQGLYVFSPISHTHPVALVGALPPGWDYWQAYDRAILECCRALYILTLPGWQESQGIQGEIGIARGLGLEIKYIDAVEATREFNAALAERFGL